MRFSLLALTAVIPSVLGAPADAQHLEVLTPSGYVPKSSALCVSAGGRVNILEDQVQILGPSGDVVHEAQRNLNASRTPRPQKRAVNHYVTAEWYYGWFNAPMTAFRTTWRVCILPYYDVYRARELVRYLQFPPQTTDRPSSYSVR